MNIHKADEKPMEIHTKKKMEIHTHVAGRTSAREKVKQGEAKEGKAEKEKTGTGKKGIFRRYREEYKEAKKSVKQKNSMLKTIRQAGTDVALNQLEGGEEAREAARIAYIPASAGAALFKRKMIVKKGIRIKRKDAGSKTAWKRMENGAEKNAGKTLRSRQAGKNLKTATKSKAKNTVKAVTKGAAKKTAKEGAKLAAKTAAGMYAPLAGIAMKRAVGNKLDKADMKRNSRNRKIQFFMDKMQAEEKQQDSVAKLVKDLAVNRMSVVVKKIAVAVGGFVLGFVALVSFTILPVLLVIAILYNSPFAFFLPPLNGGDTVKTVASSYVSDFKREVNTLAANHTGYDDGKIVYVDYEGISPDNLNDIITVYMVKYGVGDTATVMNDTSKNRLKAVVLDMCSYSTSSGTVRVDSGNGRYALKSVLYVNVTLKTCYDMIGEYGFNAKKAGLVADMMEMFQSAGGSLQQALTTQETDTIMQDMTDGKQRTVIAFALSKVGYPYSQQNRDSGEYFDCSSLAYYAWQAAGCNISYGGSNTAAAEAEGLERAGKTVAFEEMQPGDLIFYSYEQNGRYKDISHVAIYAGNGMVVEAKGTEYGVTYNAVPAMGNIVLIGRPE